MADVVPPGCERFDLELGELAAGVIDPAEVPDVAAHLESCARCRLTLDELAATADRLALLGPEREPPPGFEARALTSFRGALPRSHAAPAARRRTGWSRVGPVLAAAAVVAALVLGVVAGSRLGSSDAPTSGRVDVVGDAALQAPGGEVVGSVVALRGDRTTYVMELAEPEAGEVYDCEVVGADGARQPVGTWSVNGAKHSWTGETDRAPAAGDRLQLVDATGQVAATAALP